MALALAVGALCGLFNGLTTTLGKIEPFIVTLGTMGIFRSLLTWLAQGGSITIKNPDVRAAYRPVYFGDVFGVPYPVCVILGVAADRRLHPLPHRLRPPRARRSAPTRTSRAIPASTSRACARITYVLQGLCVAHRGHRLRAAAGFDDARRPGSAGN